jgi:hypothetical protein
MKEIIYRVTLDRTDETVSFTLDDYERFCNEASDFDIPADTPIGVVPQVDNFGYGPLMVQRIEVVE